MALEKTGNSQFDTLAAHIEKKIQNGVNVSPVVAEDMLKAAALADDQQVSEKEQLVINALKGKIPASKSTAELEAGEAPVTPAKAEKPTSPSKPTKPRPPTGKGSSVKAVSGFPYTSEAKSNFGTFFLNFAQLPEGKELGKVIPKPVPHLSKADSNLFAQKLGYASTKDMQEKIGAFPDETVGPETLTKLHLVREAAVSRIAQASDYATLMAAKASARPGLEESTLNAVVEKKLEALRTEATKDAEVAEDLPGLKAAIAKAKTIAGDDPVVAQKLAEITKAKMDAFQQKAVALVKEVAKEGVTKADLEKALQTAISKYADTPDDPVGKAVKAAFVAEVTKLGVPQAEALAAVEKELEGLEQKLFKKDGIKPDKARGELKSIRDRLADIKAQVEKKGLAGEAAIQTATGRVEKRAELVNGLIEHKDAGWTADDDTALPILNNPEQYNLAQPAHKAKLHNAVLTGNVVDRDKNASKEALLNDKDLNGTILAMDGETVTNMLFYQSKGNMNAILNKMATDPKVSHDALQKVFGHHEMKTEYLQQLVNNRGDLTTQARGALFNALFSRDEDAARKLAGSFTHAELSQPGVMKRLVEGGSDRKEAEKLKTYLDKYRDVPEAGRAAYVKALAEATRAVNDDSSEILVLELLNKDLAGVPEEMLAELWKNVKHDSWWWWASRDEEETMRLIERALPNDKQHLLK